MDQRPFLGLIVEGDGEYSTFPSIINRLISTRGTFIPIQNARGIGNIIRNIEGFLDDIVIARKPKSVIVTFDLRDALKNIKYDTCQSIKKDFLKRCKQWLSNRKNNQKFQPLPDNIEVVIQIQTFETWLIADTQGLSNHECFCNKIAEIKWTNVDNEVINPMKWIEQKQKKSFNSKNPNAIKRAFGYCCLNNISKCSRSFRKFKKEVTCAYEKYEKWLNDSVEGE